MDPESGDASKQSYFPQAPASSSQQQSGAAEHDDGVIPPPTPTTEQPPPAPSSSVASPPSTVPGRPRSSTAPARDVQFHPLDRQQSAIRLRRLPPPPNTGSRTGRPATGRRRSSSEPHQPAQPAVMGQALPPLSETADGDRTSQEEAVIVPIDDGRGGVRRILGSRRRAVVQQPSKNKDGDDCYDSKIVDFLDVIDPEVATLSSITNVQNSLFVPSLGRWVNRRPTYDLSALRPMPGAFPESTEDVSGEDAIQDDRPPTIQHAPSISSVLTDTQYAILPENTTLEGWRAEDIKLLNDYVRHMLHSRRSKMKQRLKAFGQYTKRPLGFLVTLYATLITLFGLAWVLFLIGWIYVGEKQLYAINVIDIVLVRSLCQPRCPPSDCFQVVLFNIVGVGLAPFRAIDTYHMIYVAHYHRKTWKMRKKLLLPKLKDRNDLPTADMNVSNESDIEAGLQGHTDTYFPVLSEKEQETLLYHQTKLAKSHTFYKPHETETHHAFPLRLLITVVLLLDLHSCLQITLGACTYGIEYAHRPAAVTTTVLCCSIATNAAAGIIISIGDRRTRKKDVLERLLKQELTAAAMAKVKKQKEKEEKEAREKEEGKDEVGLLGLANLPIVEKIRKSADGGSRSSINRKDKDQVGRFDTGVSVHDAASA
ncbi:hypothetical protein QBC47DRAFT_331875 [Echria macrotheca]|uniref:Integral membrane protein n=1 Tax=Echria macrotheca TaxID=438768 RepID=A0AAJ0B2C7_9PEZI|nr:hypothetical protein QBC47DRAFT_331875 [Echria macrotheca]